VECKVRHADRGLGRSCPFLFRRRGKKAEDIGIARSSDPAISRLFAHNGPRGGGGGGGDRGPLITCMGRRRSGLNTHAHFQLPIHWRARRWKGLDFIRGKGSYVFLARRPAISNEGSRQGPVANERLRLRRDQTIFFRPHQRGIPGIRAGSLAVCIFRPFISPTRLDVSSPPRECGSDWLALLGGDGSSRVQPKRARSKPTSSARPAKSFSELEGGGNGEIMQMLLLPSPPSPSPSLCFLAARCATRIRFPLRF